MVVPALWPSTVLPLGWLEFCVSCGFFAAMALTYVAFMRYFPLAPLSPEIT